MAFPYAYGTRFLQSLLEQGGPAAVDAAFRDPPVSTEQVIDPERYFLRDEPQIIDAGDFGDVMPAPWKMIEGMTVGQFNLGLILAVHLGENSVDEAVFNWDGDLLIGWWRTDTDDCCFGYYSTWDGPAAARAFFRAARELAAARLPAGAASFRSDTHAAWLAGDRLTYLRIAGRDVLYIENMPQKAAARAIMRFGAAVKRPFGTVVPIADRDRIQPGGTKALPFSVNPE